MDLILSQKDVLSIYLKTPLDVLVARLLSEKENRPVVAHLDTEEKLNDFIRKHLFERSYYYNQAALIIDNGNESVNDTVEKIILKLF
jgi:shikimate kinase